MTAVEVDNSSPANILLITDDAARLIGLSVRAIRHKCLAGKYPGATKGANGWVIPLTSLPPAAQTQYSIAHHKSAPTENLPAVQPSALTHHEYNGIWETYSRKSEGIKAEAQRRVKILDEYVELISLKISAGAAEDNIKQRYVSKATLWRWKKIIVGHPRQHWEPLLAPQYTDRSRTEIHPQAWAYFRHNYGRQSEPSATVIYRDTLKAAAANGWGALPSCRTFERRWDSDVPDNEKILARKGKTALKESLSHLKRDFTTLNIHEVWESDGRVSDVSCSWPDGTVVRPWTVVIRDVRTRMPLALKIYTSTNAELVIDAYRNAVTLTGTTPENFHLDNGNEYSNEPFTGGQKSKVRTVSVIKNQPIGVLTRGGVKVIWTTPFHGSAKSIESWWNVIAEEVDKCFCRAYTGRNPVERPQDWDPKHAVPIEEYAARLISVMAAWAKGEMGKHRGHGMNGMSPLELYNSLMPSHEKRPASAEELRAMRPLIFKRTLSTQRVFQLTIPGFGQVEYEPGDDNEKVRRGYQYDILPDPTDPKKPALIYDGVRYMGDAAYKGHTPYLSETAGGEIAQRRSRAYKKAATGIKDVQQIAEGIMPQLAPCGDLSSLLQPGWTDVLKLPKEQPPEPPPRYEELPNGDLLDTYDKTITPKLKPQTTEKPKRTAEEIEAELEQLAATQSAKRTAAKLKYY